MTDFDNFESLLLPRIIKQNINPDKNAYIITEEDNIKNYTYGFYETIIVPRFYLHYVRIYGYDFILNKVNKLPAGITKDWALYCINRLPILIEMENDFFDDKLLDLCTKLKISYQLLKSKFDNYKPFFTVEDYFRFAYKNIDNKDISYFYILLILFINDDFEEISEITNYYNYKICEKKCVCTLAARCKEKEKCLLNRVYNSDSHIRDEIINFQLKTTKSFIEIAPKGSKEKILCQLYKSFEQINKTQIYDKKLSTSFSKVLYHNGYPLSGDIYIPWNKVTFFNGYYMVEHPSKYNNIKTSPIRVNNEKSRKAFNDINSYFLKKLPPLHVQAKNGRIINVLNKPNLNDCISIMEYKTYAPADIKENRKQETKFQKKEISKSEIKSFCKEFKSKYLDYLCDKQIDNYHVICCIENRVNSNLSTISEYSFIFTFKETNKLLYLAFENATDSRCTYVFPIPKVLWKISIDKLYDFFASNKINKRLSLSQKRIDLELPGNYEFKRILHTNYLTWVDKIKYCI